VSAVLRQKRGIQMFMVASKKRSIVKALTYRIIIVCLDFIFIYLLTKKIEMAVGFMIVSNIYTTVGYFLHERAWTHIRWGMQARAGA